MGFNAAYIIGFWFKINKTNKHTYHRVIKREVAFKENLLRQGITNFKSGLGVNSPRKEGQSAGSELSIPKLKLNTINTKTLSHKLIKSNFIIKNYIHIYIQQTNILSPLHTNKN